MRDKQSRTPLSKRDWVASLPEAAAKAVADADTDQPHLYARVAASPDQLATIRSQVAQWSRQLGMDRGLVQDVVLAIDEAVSNSVEHAYAGRAGVVTLFAAVDRSTADLRVIVSDNGCWRAPPADPGTRGRGLAMMENLAHEFEIEKGGYGTTVVLTWRARSALRSGCAA